MSRRGFCCTCRRLINPEPEARARSYWMSPFQITALSVIHSRPWGSRFAFDALEKRWHRCTFSWEVLLVFKSKPCFHTKSWPCKTDVDENLISFLPEQDGFLPPPAFENEERGAKDQAEKEGGCDKVDKPEKAPRKMLSRGKEWI